MPTGFTSNIYNNNIESFEAFVLYCARGMGAFMHQRDNSTKEMPSLRKIGDYYFKALAQAEAKLYKFNSLGSAELNDMYWEEADQHGKAERDSYENKEALKARYETRLAEVRAWKVPEILESFKEFMEDQLTSSINFDCKHYKSYFPLTFDEWVETKRERLQSAVDYAQQNLNDEVRRVKEQNAYALALYEALGLTID